MQALLAADYLEQCLWQTESPAPNLTPSQVPRSVDVAIVGAGLCGLAAARRFAIEGRSVAVFEKEPLGWGASTRNGGMVIPALKAGPSTLEKKHGPLGRRMYRDVKEAFGFIESMIAGKAGGTAGSFDCDYARTGRLLLAHRPRHVATLESLAQEHSELGEDVRFVGREQLAEELDSPSFHGGALFEQTAGLHPGKFHSELVRAALGAGALILDRTAVTSVASAGAGVATHDVSTTRGRCAAGEIFVATNATADDAVPFLNRRVLPVGSFIIATDRLPSDITRSVSRHRRMMVDTKNFLFYWRLNADDRLIFGGRRSLDATDINDARDFLYTSLLEIYPQLEGTSIARAWGGNVAMTLDRMPHVGRTDGCWYATGCNGSGGALNTWMGDRLAQHILGNAAAPSFAELKHPKIPFSRWRSTYLPWVSRYFALQDRFG